VVKTGKSCEGIVAVVERLGRERVKALMLEVRDSGEGKSEGVERLLVGNWLILKGEMVTEVVEGSGETEV
jgi:hypothetical protein